ncbi:transporter substrate-binding domain-containing protein [Coleofasciculus sp. FACHB-64]|uniref:transporter substrate-binding domain-containing protein n=1 Tax=Cyanophyceae TaxID=3028117 RepID=UPI001685798A|nr:MULTISPECIES: transporter substrate-binding domain-containing protein [unclassified Coleofasciculus]MBD1836840.1 transporter substrate-binding domain-containing protein [Coleofasciculus sp. FACHB-501]MBD2046780.1 transporter substrate-binding domain-containing protein [Coleofasciculus sp. FACHB-64]
MFFLWLFASIKTPNLAVAAELQEIVERGYLIVAVKDNVRPLAFRDGEGKLQGLEIDIAQRLAAELLDKPDAVKLQPVANRERLSVVVDGTVDLTIARVTQNASRDRLVNFSIPYYLDGTALVTQDASLQRLNDLQQRKVAVLKGSDTISTVRYLIPQVQLIGVDSYEQARSLLESGNADAFAADASILSGWVQEYPQYRLLPVRLSGEPLAVVMPKGLQYNQLRQRVNDAIARWKREGWLQERVKYWGLPQSDTNRF